YSMCIIWQSNQGLYEMILDGHTIKKGKRCKGCVVLGGGSLVLGLEQDHPGGGFNPLQASDAHITQVFLWGSKIPLQLLQPYIMCCTPVQQHFENKSSEFQRNKYTDRQARNNLQTLHLQDKEKMTLELLNSSMTNSLCSSPPYPLLPHKGHNAIMTWGHTPLAVMGGAIMAVLNLY
ncbi:unnamed protein product, partial [Meganyctiphanes norvegica]